MYIGSKKRSITPFIILVFASLAILAIYLNEGETGRIHGVQSATIGVFSKAQAIARSATKPFTNAWATVANFNNLISENSKLKQEVARLNKERMEKEQAKEENLRLRKLLKFTKKIAYESMPASIIGIGLPQATLVLDKGSRDGISQNMPVVVDSGLVGKVLRVSPDAVLVQMITDSKSAVGAKIRETGDMGIIEGEAGGKLLFKFLPTESKVKKGDHVVTSGMGGIFPKDIAAGIVTNVRSDTSSRQVIVEVRPAVDFSQIEQVFVITNPPKPISEQFKE